MVRKKLPKHLTNLVKNIDAGRDVHGKPLSNSKRRAIAKLIGARTFLSKTGRLTKVAKAK